MLQALKQSEANFLNRLDAETNGSCPWPLYVLGTSC
jgi:hypothetical protein